MLTFEPIQLNRRGEYLEYYRQCLEKASLDFIGIYQAINRRMLMSLPENITCVNREQDLGLPGLRKAKTEYRPVDFIRKQKLMYQINTQE